MYCGRLPDPCWKLGWVAEARGRKQQCCLGTVVVEARCSEIAAAGEKGQACRTEDAAVAADGRDQECCPKTAAAENELEYQAEAAVAGNDQTYQAAAAGPVEEQPFQAAMAANEQDYLLEVAVDE